jgi:hypothetical protein
MLKIKKVEKNIISTYFKVNITLAPTVQIMQEVCLRNPVTYKSHSKTTCCSPAHRRMADNFSPSGRANFNIISVIFKT